MSLFSRLALLPEDSVQCSICLDIFINPVTTPCGHSFCKTCLDEQWDEGEFCHCPTCNKRFNARPEISTSAVIKEISAQIKRRKTEMHESMLTPWEVKCDICVDVKLNAHKSCVTCVTSYCEAHLERHMRVPSLMKHRLIKPVNNLEKRICEKHEKLLELFCRHEKENIESEKTKIKMMIEERVEKMEEFRKSSERTREKLHTEIDQYINTLRSRIEEKNSQLRSHFEDKLRKSQERHESRVGELQEDITELQRLQSELEELSHNNDHFQLLQTLQALSSISGTKGWSKVRALPDLAVHTVGRAMANLLHSVEVQAKNGRTDKLTDTELREMRQYAESITFDPDTAGCGLAVSKSGKCLRFSTTASSSSAQSSDQPMVLGTKGFTSKQHYWEVEVGFRNNLDEWDVGVAVETVTRTGAVILKPENGFFAIGKRGSNYQVHCTPPNDLSLRSRPRNIGVYVDYERALVSFYDTNRKLHIYSFAAVSFTERIFPYFYLCNKANNSEPLIITDI